MQSEAFEDPTYIGHYKSQHCMEFAQEIQIVLTQIEDIISTNAPAWNTAANQATWDAIKDQNNAYTISAREVAIDIIYSAAHMKGVITSCLCNESRLSEY